jgi:hypothetical protein
MALDWRALWRACVIVFFLFAVVCPLSNYRDWLWLVILSVGISAPFLLLSTILLVASLIALLYRRPQIAAAAIVAALASFFGAIFAAWIHPNSPIVRTASYRMLMDPAFRIIITMPTVVLGVPIAAGILALKQALMKRWRSALGFTAVPVAGALLFWLSGIAAGLLTLWSCAGPIQSALQTVKSGGRLPKESQRYPIAVLHTEPDVAVEGLDSFMDFPNFITYDTEDRLEAAVAARVHKSEAPACEHADARKVWGDYYWVSIGC